MKKEILIVLFGTGSVAASFFLGQAYYQKAPTIVPVIHRTQTQTPVSPVNDVFVMADIAAHATVNDCWFVISGKAYSLPAGNANELSKYCGKDISALYELQTKAGAGALSVREEGSVKDATVSTSPSQNSIDSQTPSSTVVKTTAPSTVPAIVPPSVRHKNDERELFDD